MSWEQGVAISISVIPLVVIAIGMSIKEKLRIEEMLLYGFALFLCMGTAAYAIQLTELNAGIASPLSNTINEIYFIISSLTWIMGIYFFITILISFVLYLVNKQNKTIIKT